MKGLANCRSFSRGVIQCVSAAASRSAASSHRTTGPVSTGSSDADRAQHGALAPHGVRLRTSDQHQEEHQPHQVTKEQHDRRRRGRRDGRDRTVLAPGQPRRGEQHRQAAADLPVQEAQQKAGVVGDETRRQRPEREPPEQRAVQREHAGEVQQQDAAQQAAAGDVNRQQAQQRRRNHVGRQIWNDRPVRREYRPERRVVRAGGQHHESRQVVGIVQQRRHVGDQQRREQRGGHQRHASPPCAACVHGVGYRVEPYGWRASACFPADGGRFGWRSRIYAVTKGAGRTCMRPSGSSVACLAAGMASGICIAWQSRSPMRS